MFERIKKEFKFFYELEKNSKEKKLFFETVKKYNELIRAIGNKNKKKIQEKTREYVLVKTKFEKTKLYGYIQEDAKTIDNKLKCMIKNPKQNKIAYCFAGIYIISPGTFELTAIFLTFKYIGKYFIDFKNRKENAKKKC